MLQEACGCVNNKEHHLNPQHKPMLTEIHTGDWQFRLLESFLNLQYAIEDEQLYSQILVQALIHHPCFSLKGQACFINQTSFFPIFPPPGNSLYCNIKQSSYKGIAEADTLWSESLLHSSHPSHACLLSST